MSASGHERLLESKKARIAMLGIGAVLAMFGGVCAVAVLQPSATGPALAATAAFAALGSIVSIYLHRQGKLDEAGVGNPQS